MMTVATEERVSVDEFNRAFRLHPAGVAVVTADAGDGPVAMTVSVTPMTSAVLKLLVIDSYGS